MDTQHTETQTPPSRGYGFLLGMMTGSLVGAGLAAWFAPRLRTELRESATEQYRQASSRVVELTDELTKRAQAVAAAARGER